MTSLKAPKLRLLNFGAFIMQSEDKTKNLNKALVQLDNQLN